jgi:hypothetical protein
MNNNEKGFVLVFVIAVVAALSLMTASMNFYYDNALKSTTRNSVYQQVKLASESGVQAAKNWLLTEMNKDQFSLLDIQNTSHIDNSNNQCLNRHGYTDNTKDIHFTKWIKGNLGTDSKFAGIQYEVFIQRYADNIKSIYFSGTGNNSTNTSNRSSAYIRKFKDFPSDQFTVEAWFKNVRGETEEYDQHLWEWGRLWDVVFKVRRNDASGNNHQFSPRIGGVELATTPGQSNGEPVRNEWTHIAWVWDGGNSAGNVRIYQNGTLTGTWNATITEDVIPTNQDYAIGNDVNELPDVDFFALTIGEGMDGYGSNNDGTANEAETLAAEFQGVPWKGNITEFRFWSNSRTQSNIADNYRTRLTGSEPNLVSYYKFNEGSGTTANDSNTSRASDRLNHLTVMGTTLSGDAQTKWVTDVAKYPLVTDHDVAPSINVPPGEDIAYYRILSCGRGPDDQLIPLETIVSAPVIQGDIGTEGEVATVTADYGFTSTTVPNTVEFSFYNDGSSNSIYMDDEDSIDITNIPSGWTVNQSFDGNSTPLRITPQTGITLDQFKAGLTNVFYKSCGKEHDCSSNPETYTPGIRRIKVDLNYTNPALNETHGFTKNLQAREKVILTPVSWRIR